MCDSNPILAYKNQQKTNEYASPKQKTNFNMADQAELWDIEFFANNYICLVSRPLGNKNVLVD